MVSLWPWKGEDNSPASFEKTLSTLSTQIAEATTRLDQQRQSSRRLKALWTLYSTFGYLSYSIALALVLGWETWGVKEYAAIAGGPVLIYAVRALGSRLFEYRISRVQRRLNDLQKQRDETIEKLKVATKYNSTQQLLEKYGRESPKPAPSPESEQEQRPHARPAQPPAARTGLAPPPTANIRRPPSTQQPPSTGSGPKPVSPPPYPSQDRTQPFPGPPPSAPSPLPQPPPADEPGFAPNAFPNTGQYIEQPHWYDRLLDVLLGEDETQPRNRMALICGTCRLVNGQAPPGIKTPEELGRWRCGSCGAWNGDESETTKILSSLRGETLQPSEGTWERVSRAEADLQPTEGPDDDAAAASEADHTPSSGSEEEIAEFQDTPSEQETPSDHSEDLRPEPVRRSARGSRRHGKMKE